MGFKKRTESLLRIIMNEELFTFYLMYFNHFKCNLVKAASGLEFTHCQTQMIVRLICQNKLGSWNFREYDKAISVISALNQRYYVHVPREKHISPYCGDIRKYGRLGNYFTEEFEGVLHARNQSDHCQSCFVISLLKGTTLKEVWVSDFFWVLQGSI